MVEYLVVHSARLPLLILEVKIYEGYRAKVV